VGLWVAALPKLQLFKEHGVITVFAPKHVDTTIFLTFDFLSALESGETISGFDVECEVTSGTDPSPSSMLNGAATVSGVQVRQSVQDGEVGVIYLFRCTITTSTGQTKIMQCYLVVVSSNPYRAS